MTADETSRPNQRPVRSHLGGPVVPPRRPVSNQPVINLPSSLADLIDSSAQTRKVTSVERLRQLLTAYRELAIEPDEILEIRADFRSPAVMREFIMPVALHKHLAIKANQLHLTLNEFAGIILSRRLLP